MILIHDVKLLDTTSHDKNIFKEAMGQQSLVNVFWIIRICDLRSQPQNTELCKSKSLLWWLFKLEVVNFVGKNQVLSFTFLKF